MACGNLDVKRLELDGRLARLRGGIAWCEARIPTGCGRKREIARMQQAVKDRVLLAEYALDSAVQAADRALLCVLEAEISAGAPRE